MTEVRTFADSAAFSPVATVVPLGRSLSRLPVLEPPGRWRHAVLARFNELVRLPEGWDSYAGRPVSFAHANFALRILEAVCTDGTPHPQIVPGSSGDLQLEWHTSNEDIELHVRAPNDVVAWHLDALTGPDGEEVVLTNNFIVVANWLKNLVAEPAGADAAAA